MRLFLIIFSLYCLSQIYIFIFLRRAFGGGKWQIAVIFWLSLMNVFWFVRFAKLPEPFFQTWQVASHIWMGYAIFLIYCLVAADAIALLIRFLSFVSGARPLCALSSAFTPRRFAPLALGAALCLFLYGLYEAQTPRIVQVPIVTSKLPPNSAPLRVVGIADVHVSSLIGPWMLRRMASSISALEPDILLVSGDLVDTDVTGRDEDASIFRSIPARLGKFAVTGNHESYNGLEMSLDFMKKCDLTPLRAQTVDIGPITLAGVDDSIFADRFQPDTTDVLRTLDGLPHDNFILLLNHRPYSPAEEIGRFDLQFSGHTHGGQIWPGILLTRAIHQVGQGLQTLRRGDLQSLLFITNGIGFWGPPLRFLAPPEIIVFTLMPLPSEFLGEAAR